MKIDNTLVEKLAHLAKLEFDEKEKNEIRADFENIVGFVEKLNELDTTGVEPLIYITDEKNRMRADQIIPSITKAEALSNVPVKDSDYIKVPKVVKK